MQLPWLPSQLFDYFLIVSYRQSTLKLHPRFRITSNADLETTGRKNGIMLILVPSSQEARKSSVDIASVAQPILMISFSFVSRAIGLHPIVAAAVE